MKIIKFKLLWAAAIGVLFLGGDALAQKKRAPRKRTRAAATKAAPVVNTRAEADRIGNQIKALSRFLYVYGGSSATIKAIDADLKSGKLSGSAKTNAELGKKGFQQTIAVFKNELIRLEDDLRTNPALKQSFLKLIGVSEAAEIAEEQTASGQYDQAGRTLIEVINKLTDALAAMR